MKKITYFLFSIVICSINLFSQPSQYSIANRINLEGDDFWDFISIDDSTGKLFVSHGNLVQVVDANSGKLLGVIPDTKGVHGVAIAGDYNLGFTSNGRDTSVTIFRLSDLSFFRTIKLINGINPDAILYDPFTQRVFTFNGRSSNTTVIDVKATDIIVSLPLEGRPECAVTNGSGRIYVNIEDKNMIDEIDPDKITVEHSWPITPGEEPSGLAIDIENHRLFSVCSNKLMVILDADDGHIVTTLPIGERVDGVAFDSGLKRIYSSNGEGTMTVVQEIDKDNFRVLENFPTQRGARTISVYQKTHHIFLPTAEFEEPPPPTQENPHPRPKLKPGSFVVLDVEPAK
jgi:DNA-binding beta-propeller fold protein YncE